MPDVAEPSIWRVPGIAALATTTFLGFADYAVLLPVAPLWAVHGGADKTGAGLVNGTFLLFTVVVQLFVPAALRRFGWRTVLVAQLLLLGISGACYAFSDRLVPVLLLSAVRAAGFAALTVTGSAAAAQLVSPRRRGAAIGAYGLSIAIPNVVLLPLGPWLAEHVGFALVFALSALPLAGLPAARRLGTRIDRAPPERAEDGSPNAVPESGRAARRALLRPVLLLVSVTLPGGAVLTFAPQLVDRTWLSTAGLLVMGLLAALSRWRAGTLADRLGAERFLWPLVLLAAAAVALIAWAVEGDRVVPFLIGMAALGLCYGGLQNLTLVLAFDAVSPPHRHLASTTWNIGFDAGAGVGSIAVGALATLVSFSLALTVLAVVTVCAVPVALRRSRAEQQGDPRLGRSVG